MASRAQTLLRVRKNPELGMLLTLEQMKREILAEVRAEVQKTLTAVKKGNDGYSPKKGKDYFTKAEMEGLVNYILMQIPTPENGKDADEDAIAQRVQANIKVPQDGYTPIAGVDYPTKEEMQALVYTELAALFALQPKGEKGVTKAEIDQLIGKLKQKIDFKAQAAEIARALETLKGKEALDYYSLKNLPTIPKDSKKGVMRGGGEKVEYYDLSSLCDGVTKTFTIPSNKKVVWVGGTDAPSGQYRQTTDYTGTGTTTLTLTSAVAAPSQGATLHLIYIP